jgi:hypothetical protein
MKQRHACITLLLISTIVLVQSCKTTIEGPQGPTTAVYSFGKFSTEEAVDINALYDAAVKALTDLELSISQKTKDRLNATIIARDAEDKKITVELLSITKDVTKLSIRAGSFTRASRIHQMIYDCLQQ